MHPYSQFQSGPVCKEVVLLGGNSAPIVLVRLQEELLTLKLKFCNIRKQVCHSWPSQRPGKEDRDEETMGFGAKNEESFPTEIRNPLRLFLRGGL